MTEENWVGSMQIVAESVQVLNKVGLALPFLVTLAEDNKELPSEEVRLRFKLLHWILRTEAT